MATMTKQQQYRRVSAGIALGLIMNDRYTLPHDKPHLEFAFTAAWRKWEFGNFYSWMQRSATGDVKDLDVIHIITEMDKDKHSPHMPFYWDYYAQDGPTIYARPDNAFDPDNDDDLDYYAGILSDSKISADAWAELARAFLEKLDKD